MESTEFNFINSIKSKFSNQYRENSIGIGDDCSVIPLNETTYQLTTTDLLVENIHFIRSKSTGFQLGYKSLMVNLSDIAAMGGYPSQVYLSLAIPKNLNEKFLDEFINGFHNGCKEYDLPLLGGDTTSSKKELTISITVQGTVDKSNLKLRSGAKSGDLICVTSNLGDSAMGLEVIINNLKTTNNKFFLDKHNLPKAHIKEGNLLASLNGVNAMMDISDGVSSDIKHICNLSNLGANIHLDQLPLSEDYKRTCKLHNFDLYEKALSGGEDYNLIFTTNKNDYPLIENSFFSKFKSPITIIGQMTSNSKITYFENNKPTAKVYLGFDHFKEAPSQELKKYECVMSIAGSDSGGGAGIQADLKTISALGGYPTTAITCITAQNTVGVQSVHPLPIDIITNQISSIISDINTNTIKIGLLANNKIIKAVSDLLGKLNKNNSYKIILDPVMIATSGDLLLEEIAINTMIQNLLPLTYLVTPNIHEAETLTKLKITSEDDVKKSCLMLHEMGAKNVLIKGGHINSNLATDILFISNTKSFHKFTTNKIITKNTHGTGCTFSAAIATFLAKGLPLKDSVKLSKNFIQNAIYEGSKYQLGKGAGPLKLN